MTEKEKEVLVNWLKTCVKLTGENAAEFQRLLELEENKEIRQMETTWLGRAEAKGVKKGLVQGRKEGKAEAVVQMRLAVLEGLERRFGPVPKRVQRRLEAIGSLERLRELVARLPSVESVSDLVAPNRAPSAPS